MRDRDRSGCEKDLADARLSLRALVLLANPTGVFDLSSAIDASDR
jgi:hypothetical protein